MEKKYIWIDVGGSSIKYAIIDRELHFYEERNIVIPYEGVEKYLDVLEGIYQKYCGI